LNVTAVTLYDKLSALSHRLYVICGPMVLSRDDNPVQQPIKQPVQRQEISYVTWSVRGIRVVYTDAMVVHLSAEDMFPLAEKSQVVSLVASDRRTMVARAV